MTPPTAFGHFALTRSASDTAEGGLGRAHPSLPPQPVQLGTLGSRVLAGLVAGDARDLLAEYRGFAEALADPETGDRTRRVDVSRAIAVARAEQGTMDVLLAQALSCRDFEAAEAIGKQLDRLTRRIDSLLSHHRAEFAPRRPVVVVKAENANVLAVSGGSR